MLRQDFPPEWFSLPRVSDRWVQTARGRLLCNFKGRLRSVFQFYSRLRSGANFIGEGYRWGWRQTMDKGCWVGRYCYIGSNFESAGPIVVGDFCLISSEVKVVGNDHDHKSVGVPIRLADGPSRPITVISPDCWIGKRVTLFAGVRLGRGAVIGSGSVVTKDVEPYAIYAGVPAKRIGFRFSPDAAAKHDLSIYGAPIESSCPHLS